MCAFCMTRSVFYLLFLDLRIQCTKILNQKAQMRDLILVEPLCRDQSLLASAEQSIGGDLKKIRHSDEHFDRRLHVIVFPVGNALLGYVHTSGKFHLIQAVLDA